MPAQLKKNYVVNPYKDGVDYDDCVNPDCGERDVVLRFKSGGRDGHGEEYRDWSIFHCDPRGGGCGTTWERTTKQGAQRGVAKNYPTPRLTRDADRTIFAPTEAYRSNYSRIFGHD